MKINGSNGSNINFVEQRSSSLEQIKKTNNQATSTINDRYEQKTKGMSYASITKTNESLAVLQVANSAIEKLQAQNQELQNLIKKADYFPEERSELEALFEATSEQMMDIVDNTHFGQTQLFYTPLRLSAGNEEFNFSLGSDFGIEDFSMENEEGLKRFEQNLLEIKESIQQNTKYIEVASFNSLASMDGYQSHELEKVSYKGFHTLEAHSELSSKEDLSRAHDMSSLKDKASLLLG